MSNNGVHINVSLIPEHVSDNLAQKTLWFIRRIKSTPEGKAAFEKKRAELGL